jgi:trehalose 2-sulfotransferase
LLAFPHTVITASLDTKTTEIGASPRARLGEAPVRDLTVRVEPRGISTMMTSFPSRAYFICCDARTGSSLLAGTLRLTEVAGKPFEYFGRAEIDKPWLRYELRVPDDEPFTDFRNWRDYILRAGSEPNGIFGASVHWFQFENALSTFDMPPPAEARADRRPIEVLRAFFPDLRLIWLRRKNIVAQAISHYVAIKTGEWHRRSSSASTIRAPSADQAERLAPYDFSAIDWQVKSAIVASGGWRAVLAESKEPPLELTYEEVSTDLAGTVKKVLDHLGVSLGSTPVPPPLLLKQASDWSAELERIYREDRHARGLGPVGDEACL